MSYSEICSTRCSPDGALNVDRRIATALWNQEERERIIAMKAHDVFCSRGCEHGFDLDDWLEAERQLECGAGDVVIVQSDAAFDISIAERAGQQRILLGVSQTSLLILWTRDDAESSEEGTGGSTLRLASLPEAANPQEAEVTFRDGRVWLHLPRVHNGGHLQSQPDTEVLRAGA